MNDIRKTVRIYNTDFDLNYSVHQAEYRSTMIELLIHSNSYNVIQILRRTLWVLYQVATSSIWISRLRSITKSSWELVIRLQNEFNSLHGTHGWSMVTILRDDLHSSMITVLRDDLHSSMIIILQDDYHSSRWFPFVNDRHSPRWSSSINDRHPSR